ncbi:MAG: M16 family metallopeptidase [Thalassobaculaceae bacterium]
MIHVPFRPLRRAALALVTLLVVSVTATAPAGAIDITQVTSPGGIKAWLVEDHSNPVIALNVRFSLGSADDPAGKAGAARLLAATVDEGAGDLESTAFQAALKDQSISLSFRAGMDATRAALMTLTDTSEDAFRLFRLALTEPRFDAEPVQRMRQQLLAAAQRKDNDPSSQASRLWWRAAFPDHPYGRPRDGTVSGLSAVTVADLRTLHAGGLTRDGLTVSVVGDITPARLAAVLDELFGALPAKRQLPAVASTPPDTGGQVYVMTENIPQAQVVFGHAGIDTADPDWFGAAILMEIMSGGFGSRLMTEVREKRGLAYGVSAGLAPLDRSALVIGGTATRNDRVADSLAVIRAEWRRMAAQGPNPAEIADAKAAIIGGYALGLTDSPAIARRLTGLQSIGLPISYFEERAARINAVTADDLRRIAKRLFQVDKLTIAVVGEPVGVTATGTLPALN